MNIAKFVRYADKTASLSFLLRFAQILMITALGTQLYAAEPSLTLLGTHFGTNGTTMPSSAICPGETTPAFSWRDAPSGTEAFVITMHAPIYDESQAVPEEQRPFKWWWILYNIPGSASSVDAGGTADGTLGTNVAKGEPAVGYSPPCPQGGGTDIPLSFTLFALSEEIDAESAISVTWEELQRLMDGKLLASSTLNATFDRIVAPDTAPDGPSAAH